MLRQEHQIWLWRKSRDMEPELIIYVTSDRNKAMDRMLTNRWKRTLFLNVPACVNKKRIMTISCQWNSYGPSVIDSLEKVLMTCWRIKTFVCHGIQWRCPSWVLCAARPIQLFSERWTTGLSGKTGFCWPWPKSLGWFYLGMLRLWIWKSDFGGKASS